MDDAKRRAAEVALTLLPETGTIGLGTGSTAKLFIEGLGRLIREGRRYDCVPTSEASKKQALELGIPLLSEDGPWDIDVCVDGADEVSARCDLIKGGGGCHTREKMVNAAARKNLIVVDDSKLSTKLGEKWPVPVEVLAFAHRATAQLLSRFGTPTLRMSGDRPFCTDSGNVIYDLRAGIIESPEALERDLALLPGVVDSGLFVGRADLVIVAGGPGREAEVRRLAPPL